MVRHVAAGLMEQRAGPLSRVTAQRRHGQMRFVRAALILAASSMAGGALSLPASAETVGACSGVRLPPSVVTNILGNVLVPVLTPVEGLLGTLTLGTVNLGLSGALSNAASGAPINLGAININGGTVDLLTNPGCNSQADAFTLTTPKGLSIGGNSITGLGQTGLAASAGELDAIAIGDLASTTIGANRAIAFGAGATASHAGSVALGAGSIANGSTLGLSAYLVGGTAAAEVNIGARRITGLAAGANATDAVNVAQLTAVNDTVTGLSSAAVQYDGVSRNLVTLQGASGTRIANVAAGAVNATSMDAVNGSQLHGTNLAVTQLGYDVTALDGLAVKYQDGTRTAVTFGGVSGTRLSNVAAGVATDDAVNVGQLAALATTVGGVRDDALRYDSVSASYSALRSGTATRISGVAAGALDSQSSDAVNGAQLAATNATVTQNSTAITQINQSVAALDSNAVKYQDSSKSVIALGGASGTRIANVAAGVADGDAVNVAQLNAVSTSVGSVRNEALLYDTSVSAYNAARGGADQRLTGVAAGSVAAGSSDAVNGAQLAETNAAVTLAGQRVGAMASSTATHLGGGAAVQADGSISAPHYALVTVGTDGTRGTSTYDSVGSALDSLGTSVANVSQRIDSVAAVSQRAVAYDGAPGAARDTVTFAGAQGTRLTNVQAGEVSATSTDAVTGAQLNATNTRLASTTVIVNALRDGTDGYLQVNNAANLPKPAATGANSLAAGAGAVASGTNGTALGTQAQALAANSAAVGYGSVADRANSLSVGSVGAERQITNVTDGSSAMDAVNMRQLQGGMNDTLLTANAYTDSRFQQVSWDMHGLRRDAQAGTASAMALSALVQPIEAGRAMLGVGTSIWQGETAIAMGFSRASDDGRLILKAGATYNSRKQGGANAGFGLAF
ncbi:MAG TPA: YadA-like family protein [Sphingobium sp.]